WRLGLPHENIRRRRQTFRAGKAHRAGHNPRKPVDNFLQDAQIIESRGNSGKENYCWQGLKGKQKTQAMPDRRIIAAVPREVSIKELRARLRKPQEDDYFFAYK